MATLTPLKANADGSISGAYLNWSRSSGSWSPGTINPTNTYSYVDEAITSAAADGDTAIGQQGGANATASVRLELTATDSDFDSMDTLSIRYSTVQIGAYSDDSGFIAAQVRKADGTTIIAASAAGNGLLLDYFNGSNWSATSTTGYSDGTGTAPGYDKTNSFTLTTAGQNATQTEWDNAQIWFWFVDSRNMGADSASIILVDFEITGTYTAVVPPRLSFRRIPIRKRGNFNTNTRF